MYKVIDIIEPDFGCEGLPEGQEPCCDVILKNENGDVKTVSIPDAELYRKDILPGGEVSYKNGVITKIE